MYYITCDIPVFDDKQDTYLVRRYFTQHNTWSAHKGDRVLMDFQTALREHERLRVINPFGIRNVTMHDEPIVIDRSRAKAGRRVEWKWAYTVTLPGQRPVTIGHSLSEARSWARRHSRSTSTIVFTWEQT